MKNLLIFFLILSIGKIYGQDNFKRGYIITNELDTVTGWIDFRTDAQNMSVCNFKTNETEKAITYLPGEIYGYRFYQEGKYYISKKITVNNAPRTVFLEYLVQGVMNLFYYVYVDYSTAEQNTGYYFFEDKQGIITQVTKKPDEFIKDNEERMRIHEDFRYKGMIKYLFKDLESISKETDKLEFNQKSMINIAKEYHYQVCTTGEECIVFETKEDKAYHLFKFSVYGGVQLYYERDLDIMVSPVIGGKMNISVPRFNKNLSFQADVAICKAHGTATFNRENSPEFGNEEWWLDGIEFHRSYLSYWETDIIFVPLQLGAKYSFGNRKIRPVIDGGISYTSFFRGNDKVKYTYPDGHESPLFNLELGYYGEFGLFGHLGLEYILNHKNSMFVNAGGDFIFSGAVLQIKF